MQRADQRRPVRPSASRPASDVGSVKKSHVLLSEAGPARSAGPAKSKHPCHPNRIAEVSRRSPRVLAQRSHCTKASPAPANQFLQRGFPRPSKRFRQPSQQIGRDHRMFPNRFARHVSRQPVQVNRSKYS